MKTRKTRIWWQVLLLSFLLIVLLLSSTLIYLGATVFRSQIPLFQLLDQKRQDVVQINPEPAPYTGVIDLAQKPTVRLYMVLGSDYRPQAGFRTDIIIFVAMDTLTGKVSLVSFPRDLWVSIPGYGEQRINTVMQLGGFQLLADTMQTNFGVYPNQYAMIDLDGFLHIIEVLGGITFETEYRTEDACDSSLDPDRWCEVGPGKVTLDSDWALWYVRARYNSSDFDRMRRTQEVVKAVMKKILSPSGMFKIAPLMRVYNSAVESNISPDNLFPLIRLAIGFDSESDVRHYSIGPNQVIPWMTADGAAVLLPDVAAIQAVLQSALSFE
jgi:polyisoprenyl-teichoic acid--peptidoglycan teichoic acid transferase